LFALLPGGRLHTATSPTRRSSDLSRLVHFETEPADHSSSEDLTRATLERIVARSFALLAEDCQRVLTLYGDELSYGEIDSRMGLDRKSTRLNSNHVKISYAVFF